MNRERSLRDSYDLVVSTMGLRAPQVLALRELRDALLRLPAPLAKCSPEQLREYLAVRTGWRHPFHPSFVFALATGVGKTRLAGAIIAMLWLSGEARTFLVLAPRRAVLRRFENALDIRFREYLFVDPQLVPEPSVVRADEIDSPRAFEFDGDLISLGPKIFLLSPQLIATSDRFSRRPPFAVQSPREALRARSDLVVIADEAHHIGKQASRETTAWSAAVRELQPALQLGLTATPRNDPGEFVLYEYPLQQALREGVYTKSVHVCVRQFADASIDADDIDKSAILYSLDRLDRKTLAAEAGLARGAFPAVKPICVFFARDIAHAKQVQDWILSTGRVAARELLLTHSEMSKSEEELERLLSIESVDNPIRVVVNVMELTEGWDVTNVYVVTPLRAMATFQGALQAMGRGLRLPAGRRVQDPVLDELDVVCFGREALEKIVRESTNWIDVGQAERDGGTVKITQFDKADPVSVPVPIPNQRSGSLSVFKWALIEEELTLQFHSEALNRVKEAFVTEVELAAAQTRLGFGRPRLDRSRFVRAAAFRLIRKLQRYLSVEQHFEQASSIVQRWIDEVRPGQAEVEFDPIEVGNEIAKVLEVGAAIKPARYEIREERENYTFPDFVGRQEVMISQGEEVPSVAISQLPIFDGKTFVASQLYRGWKKALHPAYAFDSLPEALLALLLDRAPEVDWWVRNHPPQFRLQTPVGQYRPDFVVSLRENERERMLVLEAKGDHLWSEPTSEARLKSAAAREWAKAQSDSGIAIDARIALEESIKRSNSWGELSRLLE